MVHSPNRLIGILGLPPIYLFACYTCSKSNNRRLVLAHKSNNPLANGEDCRLGLRVFIQGILDACCINASFDLIPEKDFPQWALGKNEGMNTLVVCRNCANKKSSVESFRGKPAFVYVNDLFWFEENLAGQSPSGGQLGYPPPSITLPAKLLSPNGSTRSSSKRSERHFSPRRANGVSIATLTPHKKKPLPTQGPIFLEATPNATASSTTSCIPPKSKKP